ncbi:MAG: sulfite exporter TauE/SafE family protein [Anaerolineae bacterium]|nr:sulfite exporter TauE/SafE family protein [Anaerolineae bacterium]
MIISPELTPFILVAAVCFAGSVVQSIMGFGVALICMPFLIHILDPVGAAALVALFIMPMQVIIMWRYRRALDIRPFWRVLVGITIGTPLGVALLERLDEHIILSALGILLIAYSLYSLTRPRLREIRHPAWAFGCGLAAGVLGGAYNTGGPPVVIYGSSMGWESDQFRANLQALFMINSVLVIGAHVAAGHVSTLVLENLLVALPLTLIGTGVGFALNRFVNETVFRKAVLILLAVIGVRLLPP